MIKGVNIGNWLVLEKWMSPDLFDGTTAEDETGLCNQLPEETKLERFRTHRNSYITERDFAYLAGVGVEAVRIPVPHFVFGDREPYVGCIEYLDKAFGWAYEHGLKIMLDLHTVPGGQNGFDNGGLCGVCRWHRSPADVGFVLDLLERLALRYRGHDAFWAIEVLNEPISDQLWTTLDIPTRYPAADPDDAAASGPVPTEFLQTFYRDAYHRIRSADPDVTIVFHDGFRLAEWGSDAITRQDRRTRRDYYRRLAAAQLDAWQTTQGWFYWSYKLQVSGPHLDGWDFGKSVSLGYLPTDATGRLRMG
jgi:glucan 1,3-beta-glucosidase